MTDATDPEPDDDLDDRSREAVRALADHLTAALEAYLAEHLPPPSARGRPGGLTPKAFIAGVTLFHASFLVQIAKGVFTEPRAAARFYAVQVRTFKDALDALHDEDAEAN